MFNFDLKTAGMQLYERRELIKNIELIPLCTIVYSNGGAFDQPQEIKVTEENQKEITMFWNSMYFKKLTEAQEATDIAHGEYGDWQSEQHYR